MRISDWSSDVCSSDLTDPYRAAQRDFSNAVNIRALYEPLDHQDRDSSNDQRDRHHPGRAEQRLDLVMQYEAYQCGGNEGNKQVAYKTPRNGISPNHAMRSEERRVGQECVGTGRSRR